MTEQADEIARSEDRHAARPARLGALRRRADEARARLARMERGDQHAGARHHPAIERQLADRDPVAQLLGVGDAHRREQGEGDRQVIVRAVLGQVGGREVHRDALGRQGKAHGGERGLHALAALAHGLVRQADDVEARQPRRDLTLHLDLAGHEPQVGDRSHLRDHRRASVALPGGNCAGE